jgi:hypothetical protein
LAQEITIPNASSLAKIRNPIAVLALSFITLGIYGIFWWYYINREMADLGRAKGTDELGDSPGKSVLAITLGALIIVPAVISIVHTAQRIQAAQRLTGIEPQMNGWLALVLALVISPAFYAYEQSELNKVWRKLEAQPAVDAGTPAPVEQPPAPAPEQTPPTA